MLTNVTEIDQETYSKALDFTIDAEMNLLCFGMAGIGKTEMAQQAAVRKQKEIIYVNLSVLEAPDLLGLPTIEEVNGIKVVKYASPHFLPLKKNVGDKKYVIVLDELDKAKEELQNPCLELLQFRTINGNEVAADAIIATGNLPDEGAFSKPVSHALTNRCMVYKLAYAYEPWQSWAVGASLNPLVVGFLSRNQDWLSKKAAEGDPTAYSRPSPRSWANAARGLDKIPQGAEVDFQTLIVAGFVGQAAAVKFKVWLEHYRHVEPLVDALVSEGKHPKENMTMDRQLVCGISACSALNQLLKKPVKGGERDKHEAKIKDVTKKVFGWIRTLPTDFQVGSTKSVFTMDVITEHKLTQIQEFMDSFVKVKQAMKAP